MRIKKSLILITLVIFSVMVYSLNVSSNNDESIHQKTSTLNEKPLEWYYDNLTPEDRKKIRQAMDYAIPRQRIIDEIHDGYATAIASPIGQHEIGIYDESVQAREYNPSLAQDLLEGVFNYRYNSTATDGSEIPYFSMTLLAPSTNTARTQWAALIGRSFTAIGIDVTLKWWDWNKLMPRIFQEPIGTGFDFHHGGYDAFFVGYGTKPDHIDLKDFYDRNAFPPSANCYWIENNEIETLWNTYYAEPDPLVRADLLKDYQAWYYDNLPTSIIRQMIHPVAMDIDLEGFDLFHGIQENIANWTIGEQTSVVIAQPGDYIDFNPLLVNSYYDSLVIDNIFCSLARRRGDYNLTHAIPWLAESWIHSGDYLSWNVKLRQDIKWSDGSEVTADDVVFSYHAAMDSATGSPWTVQLEEILGDNPANTVKKINNYEVLFSLPNFYPFVETVLFDVPILQKAQMSSIPYSDWKSHVTNINSAPIGSGAYMFDTVNTNLPDTVVIKTNPYYNATLMGHDPFMDGGGNWLPYPTLQSVTFKVVREPTVAVSGLQSGVYDVIDKMMGIQGQAAAIDGSVWGKLLKIYDWNYQELAYNHYSPIWGMNPHDPREMYSNPLPDPENKLEWYYDILSSEDRKKIRQAMDYAIPREMIINVIDDGYAASIASPIVRQHTGVYDSTVNAREYNTYLALDLLEQVFGYRYNIYGEGEVTTLYFPMTLVAPITNWERTQWAGLIGFTFTNIGIDVELKWWPWDVMLPRIFFDPIGVGFDYQHGGYDAFFVGYNAEPDARYKDIYDRNSFPPSANCYWIENDEIDALWNMIYSKPDPLERANLLKAYQEWYYEEVPTSIIRQNIRPFAVDIELEGFELFHGIRQNIANWTIGEQTSAVIAQPGDYYALNPLLTDSYYDHLVLDNIFCSLARRRGEYNLTHAVPWLAKSWTPSGDYLSWNVKLRQGIKWSDGSEVTADDVVFSYHAAMDENIGYFTGVELLGEILGNNPSSVTKVNDYEVKFVLPQSYAYVETVLFDVPILQKAQMSSIPYSDWRNHDTNIIHSPIGCGAYIFDSYPDPATINLKINPHYNATLIGHDPYAVGGGNWLPNPTLQTVTFKVVQDPMVAITGLKSGVWDVIDRQMDIQHQADEIEGSDWSKLINTYDWGYQELGYNHYSPIWGMNPHDPREMYPDDYVTTVTTTYTTTTETYPTTTTPTSKTTETTKTIPTSITEPTLTTTVKPTTTEPQTTEPTSTQPMITSGFELSVILILIVCGMSLRRKFGK